MKLKRPPYPDTVGTAVYFFVQAGHRETAIDQAILIIRDFATQAPVVDAHDPIATDPIGNMGEWLVESLLQGAWMREYHEWEKATKSYFEGQHVRIGRQPPDWKARLRGNDGAASHVQRVGAQLALFNATVSASILATIDAQRRMINTAKHEDEHFATEQDYRTLAEAIADFWNELASQEEFTVRR